MCYAATPFALMPYLLHKHILLNYSHVDNLIIIVRILEELHVLACTHRQPHIKGKNQPRIHIGVFCFMILLIALCCLKWQHLHKTLIVKQISTSTEQAGLKWRGWISFFALCSGCQHHDTLRRLYNRSVGLKVFGITVYTWCRAGRAKFVCLVNRWPVISRGKKTWFL